MRSDGSIIFDTQLDTSGLRQGLKGAEQTSKDAGKAVAYTNEQLKAQEKKVARLIAEYGKLIEQADEWVSLGADVDPDAGFASQLAAAEDSMYAAQSTLDDMRQSTEQVKQDTERAAAATERMDKAGQTVDKSFSKLSSRLKGLVRRVLFFSVITMMLRSVRDYIEKISKTNDGLMASLAQLKGALLTAFQPLWETILPYLTKFIDILSKVVIWIAAFFSYLTGKSLSASAKATKNLNKEANAIEKTGKAADDAMKSLAAFDEINNISSDKAEDGAGGSAGAGGVSPSFNYDTGYLREVEGIMAKIGDYVLGIALGLLAWKIASAFTEKLHILIGIFLAIVGAVRLASQFIDAWKNGINDANFNGMFEGAIILVVGLGIAFGATGILIGGLIAGFAFLVNGIKEFIDKGEMTNESFNTIATGILIVGFAISAFTSSFIPILIAAIVTLILFIIKNWDEIKAFFVKVGKWIKDKWDAFKAWGKKTWDGVVAFFQKVVEWIKTKVVDPIVKFFQDFKKTVTEIWEGICSAIKSVINRIIGGVESMVNGIISGINWLIRKINGIPSIQLPDWDILGKYAGLEIGFSIPELSNVNIPRLAAGTVVPSNRQFLAMLGDNRHEQEVVSPLSTIRQAVIEAMGENGGGGTPAIYVYLDGKQMYDVTCKYSKQDIKRTGRYPILGD